MRTLVIAASTLVLFCGCGRQPDPVRVTGKIVMAGRPLANATVVFQCSDGAAYAASAKTDESGRFRLTTMSQDGAIPGSYRVMVSKFAGEQREQMLPEDYMFEVETVSFNETQEIVPPTPRALVPNIYAQYHTTPLQLEVNAGATNDFAIALTD